MEMSLESVPMAVSFWGRHLGSGEGAVPHSRLGYISSREAAFQKELGGGRVLPISYAPGGYWCLVTQECFSTCGNAQIPYLSFVHMWCPLSRAAAACIPS